MLRDTEPTSAPTTPRVAPAEPTRAAVGTATAPTIVLKIGGANLERPEYVERLTGHVAELVASGARVVVVHGGGTQIAELHDRLDLPFRTIDGLRVTSNETLAVTTQVLCGSMNKRLVASFVGRGLPALGVSGIDLGLLRAELVDARRLGRVGEISRVDSTRFESLLDSGLVLVVAPVSLVDDGGAANVNADSAAHAIATALEADSLDFISNVAGVRTEPESDETAECLDIAQVRELIADESVVKGGMRPKLLAATAAIERGVSRVRIGTLIGMTNGRATRIVAADSES